MLFLLPLAGWLVWSERRRLGWAVTRLALGLVPALAALLAFDQAATGSPLTLPFSLLEPNDKLGFGARQLYPSDRPHSFGIVQGLLGVSATTSGCSASAGPRAACVLVLLAVVAVVRRRVSTSGRAARSRRACCCCVGYLGFWGAWNAAELWGGTRYVGPFYVMSVLVPIVLLGARGLADLVAARRPARSGRRGGRRRRPASR